MKTIALILPPHCQKKANLGLLDKNIMRMMPEKQILATEDGEQMFHIKW